MQSVWFGVFLTALIGLLLSLAMRVGVDPKNVRAKRASLIAAIVCGGYVVMDLIVHMSTTVAIH